MIVLILQVGGNCYLFVAYSFEQLQYVAQDTIWDGAQLKGSLRCFIRGDGYINVELVRARELSTQFAFPSAHLVIPSDTVVNGDLIPFEARVLPAGLLRIDPLLKDYAVKGRLYIVERMAWPDSEQQIWPVTL